MECTIVYLLNSEGQKRSILAGGEGKREQKITAPITAELLEVASVSQDGQLNLNITQIPSIPKEMPEYFIYGTTDFSGFQTQNFDDNWYEEKKPYIKTKDNRFSYSHKYFSEPQTVESILSFIKSHSLEVEQTKAIFKAHEEAEKERLAPELAKRIAMWEKGVALHKQRYLDAICKEKKEEAVKEAAKKERANWIATHGSDYLRRATTLGYNCQRQYLTERAAHEYPSYVVDLGNHAEWVSRSCPSLEALEQVELLIAEGVNAEVVWLTHPASEWEDYHEEREWQNHEAIVIKDYFSKYTIVKDLGK